MRKNSIVFAVSLILLMLVSNTSYSNNSIYIATSNSIAKQAELEVTANNAANVNTPGYEEDSVIFQPRIHKESKSKSDAFVVPKGNYRKSSEAALNNTGNPLDMAIVGNNGYFMLLTPRGPRYSLSGAALIDNTNTLVNHDGYPFANRDGQPILFPENYDTVEIRQDGTIYAGLEEVGMIGVFSFLPNTEITREGNSLYMASTQGFALDEGEATIASGALRGSNVNQTKVLTDMIELQRSNEASQELIKNIAALERATISKTLK
ncbi:MAG UNVERIFIED_CONTAM: flagellar hook basal-body protein [Rickettsiaceae bacterium]